MWQLQWVFYGHLYCPIVVRRQRCNIPFNRNNFAEFRPLAYRENSAGKGMVYVSCAADCYLCIVFILINILAAKYVVFGVLKMMAFFFSFTALMVVVIEIVTDMYMDDNVQLQWSLIVFVPLVLVSLVMLVVERKKRVKDEMRKKFHI